MDTKEFIFIGFLPVNKKDKVEKLENLKPYKQTLIFYEAPHKLINTLENIKAVIGDRRIVLAREITKIHEEYLSGTVSEVLEKVQTPKGEFVIVMEGNSRDVKNEKQRFLNTLSLEEHYEYYKKQNYDKKDIIKNIAKDRNTNKNEIYKYFIKK